MIEVIVHEVVRYRWECPECGHYSESSEKIDEGAVVYCDWCDGVATVSELHQHGGGE